MVIDVICVIHVIGIILCCKGPLVIGLIEVIGVNNFCKGHSFLLFEIFAALLLS